MSGPTPIPGIAAITCVISNECREGRGDQGAIDEALSRLRSTMVDTLNRWPKTKGATFFVAFTVDRLGRKTIERI